MVRPLGLPFDPIERAAQTWEQRFGPASAMRAATSVFRVQQILLARFDEARRVDDERRLAMRDLLLHEAGDSGEAHSATPRISYAGGTPASTFS